VLGALSASVFLLVQLFLAAHNAFVLHVRCVEDEELAHGHGAAEACAPDSGEHAHPGHSDDLHGAHCGLLLASELAEGPRAGDPSFAWRAGDGVSRELRARFEASVERLFLLAPKHSPPSAKG
jgi:hypothetical protein